MTILLSGKSDKKQLYPNHMHILIPCRKHLQSFKKTVQNCKRRCAHKTPRVNADGWTDECMETCTPVAHAKAGAAKYRSAYLSCKCYEWTEKWTGPNHYDPLNLGA